MPSLHPFQVLEASYGPMLIKLHKHEFDTLKVDYDRESLKSPNRNKWILVVVCRYFNSFWTFPNPDNAFSTSAFALFHDILLVQ